MKNSTQLTLLAGSILAYHLVVGAQGFDMCDEGWSLTGYQQIFRAPESVEYLFLYYLTNVVGGLWNLFFGFGGIFAFRVLTALVLAAMGAIVWRMLRPHFSTAAIATGLFAAFACSYYGVMVFYHNHLSALLSTCAALLIARALATDSRRWMLAGGCLIGCNIFVRLPNVTQLSLLLLVIPYYIYRRDSGKTLKMLATGCGGAAAGAAMVAGLMLALGHLSIFADAIDSGFSAAADADSTHNLSQMLSTYAGVYKTMLTQGIFNNTHTVYLLGTLCCLRVVCSRRYTGEVVYLACAALLIMHTLPLGSDFGIDNMGENSVYLAAPLTAGIVARELRTLRRMRLPLQGLCAVALALFFARGARLIMGQCYFDEGSRLEKTCRISHPLATTLTTARNCQQLDPLLRQLERYVGEGDYLLCFQNSPTIHYLTRTRPYLYNPWVWTYSPATMERKMQQAEQTIGTLPVMVRDKSMLPYWYEYDPDWDNEHAQDTYTHKNRKIHLIRQFAGKHGYRVVWENEVFQILLPPGMRP